jgi:hypothetical protein
MHYVEDYLPPTCESNPALRKALRPLTIQALSFVRHAILSGDKEILTSSKLLSGLGKIEQ